MRANEGHFFRACYSKGVSHQHHLRLAEAQGRQQSGKALWWRKGKASGMAFLEAIGLGALEAEKLEQDILCDRFGELICLSLVGPELKLKWEPQK